jgi:predicted ester cyclase
VLAEGDRSVIRWTARGTHQGELLGIAPTGKAVVIPGISILRVAGGKIAEHWLN